MDLGSQLLVTLELFLLSHLIESKIIMKMIEIMNILLVLFIWNSNAFSKFVQTDFNWNIFVIVFFFDMKIMATYPVTKKKKKQKKKPQQTNKQKNSLHDYDFDY